MTDLYLALKLVHILGATVLFGTGLGIAFFMVLTDDEAIAKKINSAVFPGMHWSSRPMPSSAACIFSPTIHRMRSRRRRSGSTCPISPPRAPGPQASC